MADKDLPEPDAVPQVDSHVGLSSRAASALLQRWGANAVAEPRETLARRFVASL